MCRAQGSPHQPPAPRPLGLAWCRAPCKPPPRSGTICSFSGFGLGSSSPGQDLRPRAQLSPLAGTGQCPWLGDREGTLVWPPAPGQHLSCWQPLVLKEPLKEENNFQGYSFMFIKDLQTRISSIEFLMIDKIPPISLGPGGMAASSRTTAGSENTHGGSANQPDWAVTGAG